eukprot:6132837-Prymnesium_polylepis.1
MLRVRAGTPVRAGEQLCIVYGDETTSSADFLSFYGFVNPDAPVADRLLLERHPEALAELDAATT